MPTKVTIEFMGHMVTGESEFCGPDEVEYTKIISVTPENTDERFLSDAEYAVEAAAYREYRSKWSGSYYDSGDREDYDSYSSGPDYWWDPESGEPRCG